MYLTKAAYRPAARQTPSLDGSRSVRAIAAARTGRAADSAPAQLGGQLLGHRADPAAEEPSRNVLRQLPRQVLREVRVARLPSERRLALRPGRGRVPREPRRQLLIGAVNAGDARRGPPSGSSPLALGFG